MKRDLIILGISLLVGLVLAIMISFTRYYHWIFLTIFIPGITSIYLSVKRDKNNKS